MVNAILCDVLSQDQINSCLVVKLRLFANGKEKFIIILFYIAVIPRQYLLVADETNAAFNMSCIAPVIP